MVAAVAAQERVDVVVGKGIVDEIERGRSDDAVVIINVDGTESDEIVDGVIVGKGVGVDDDAIIILDVVVVLDEGNLNEG